jgi:hypothetical protein
LGLRVDLDCFGAEKNLLLVMISKLSTLAILVTSFYCSVFFSSCHVPQNWLVCTTVALNTQQSFVIFDRQAVSACNEYLTKYMINSNGMGVL